MSAVDSRNGVAPEAIVNIRYCYCQNSSGDTTGDCPDFNALQVGFGSEDPFQLVECECFTGWSGAFTARRCLIL